MTPLNATSPARNAASIPWLVLVSVPAAVLAGAAAAHRHGPLAGIAVAVLAGLGVMLAIVDARTLRLPRPLIGSLAAGAAVLAATSAVTGDPGALVRVSAGATVSGAVLMALAVARPGGMGLGDVKLATGLGGYTGWFGAGCWAVGMVLPFLVGGTFALGLVLTRRARRDTPIPFGPFLVASALVAALCSG